MNNKRTATRPLLLLLVGLLVFSSLKVKDPVEPDPERPTLEGLAVILDAFAYNLEQDGQLEAPSLQWSSDVGDRFNLFGSRSTLGRAYRETFADQFDDLAAQLAAALDARSGPQPLTAARRSAAADVLRRFARGLK